eukprot:1160880-Pelagomonas_calceolata.AAC.3
MKKAHRKTQGKGGKGHIADQGSNNPVQVTEHFTDQHQPFCQWTPVVIVVQMAADEKGPGCMQHTGRAWLHATQRWGHGCMQHTDGAWLHANPLTLPLCNALYALYAICAAAAMHQMSWHRHSSMQVRCVGVCARLHMHATCAQAC